MAAPNGTVWSAESTGTSYKGKIGIYTSLTKTSTQVTVTAQVWYWALTTVVDSTNTFYYDWASTPTTSIGSKNINTPKTSTSWVTDNQVLIGTYTKTYTRKTTSQTGYASAKFTGIEYGGGNSKVCSTSFTIPALDNYTVTYKGNGGIWNSTDTWTSANIPYNSSYITEENFFDRTGYTFIGWNEKADGTGTDWTSWIGKPWTWTRTQNVTLYAQWKANNYTITYDGNGGIWNSTDTWSENVTYNSSYITEENFFTKTGYTFTGWNEKADGSGVSWTIGKPWTWTYTKNVTLYAQWTPNTYTVTYNGNGFTSGSTASSNHRYNTEINTGSKEYYVNYEFMQTGHDISPIIDKHGVGKYLIEFDLYSDVSGTMKVYIQNGSDFKYQFYQAFTSTTSWKHYSFIVDVSLADASVTKSMLAFYGDYGTGNNPHVKNIIFTKCDENLTTNGYSRTGYTFKGWNTKTDGTGTYYADNASVKNLTSVNGGTVTLYAQWKANTYTITYNGNGGLYNGNVTWSENVVYDNDYTTWDNFFAREGYAFVGWNESQDGSGVSWTNSINKPWNWTYTRDVILYAQWEKGVPNTFVVYYNANGGYNEPTFQTKTAGVNLTLSTKKPTRKGYIFNGWGTSRTSTTPSYNAGSIYSTDANITLYAVWLIDDKDIYIYENSLSCECVKFIEGVGEKQFDKNGYVYANEFIEGNEILIGNTMSYIEIIER